MDKPVNASEKHNICHIFRLTNNFQVSRTINKKVKFVFMFVNRLTLDFKFSCDLVTLMLMEKSVYGL